MLFNIERDTGDQIVGYLVPDNYSAIATLVVTSGADELLRMPTDELRQSLVNARRHETGICGFTLDAEKIPGLAKIDDITIKDVDSGVMVYRRTSMPTINMRLLRLETHLFPLSPLDDAIGKHFRYVFSGMERWGRETIEQIFHLNTGNSFYTSGRFFLRHFDHLLDAKIGIIAVIRNPHYELAERLLILNRLAHTPGVLFGLRDSIIYEEAIEFAADLDFKDEKRLRRAFRSMPEPVSSLLSNPLVRSLAAQTQEEVLYAGSISTALDALASFAVVGLRSHPSPFLQALSAHLNIPEAEFAPIREYPSVIELGEMLCNIKAATGIIERDLELFEYVVHAFNQNQ